MPVCRSCHTAAGRQQQRASIYENDSVTWTCCIQLYTRPVAEADIRETDQSRVSYTNHIRKYFLDTTFVPKQHIWEHHSVDLMKTQHFGLASHGEGGGGGGGAGSAKKLTLSSMSWKDVFEEWTKKEIKYRLLWKNTLLSSLLFSGLFCHLHQRSGKSRWHFLNVCLFAWPLISLLAFHRLTSSLWWNGQQGNSGSITSWLNVWVILLNKRVLLPWLQSTLNCWTCGSFC